MSGLLAGRVAVVSGIGPGMGRDVSLALAREGADLVLAARTASKIAEVAAEVRAAGRRALEVPSRHHERRRLPAPRRRARAPSTAASTCSSTTPSTWAASCASRTPSAEDLLRPLRVNLLGSMQLTREVLPVMKEQRRGSIVMINSMIIRDVLPNMGPYGASKAALMAATQGLAREIGVARHPRQLGRARLHLGRVARRATSRIRRSSAASIAQVVYDEVAAQTALRHLPTSEEIADAVVFFASDLSRVVTGQSLDVNGGHVFH